MKDKYKIIEELANKQLVEEILGNISGKTNEDREDVEDLIQETYLSLLSKDEELIQDLYKTNAFNFYIQKMLWNNMYSSNSPYYYKYKNYRKRRKQLFSETTTRDDT